MFEQPQPKPSVRARFARRKAPFSWFRNRRQIVENAVLAFMIWTLFPDGERLWNVIAIVLALLVSFALLPFLERAWYWVFAPYYVTKAENKRLRRALKMAHEKLALLKTEQRIDLTRPRLHGTIQEPIVIGEQDGGVGVIAFNLAISNSGIATAINQWGAYVVEPGSGTRPHVQIVEFRPDSQITLMRAEGAPIQFSGVDLIGYKALKPIPTGGIVSGVFVIRVPSLTSEALKRPQTEIGIYFKDVPGNEYSTKVVISRSEPPVS